MQNKLCLINQPAGLGDILLCQKIAKNYVNKGYRVLWPVDPVYSYIGEYIKTDGVTFCSMEDEFEYKQFFIQNFEYPFIHENEKLLYVPIKNADRIIQTRSMLYAKYEFCKLDPVDWLDAFALIRNKDREMELTKQVNSNQLKDYIVVNRTYGTPPNVASNYSINPTSTLPIIEMRLLGWERIFDWIDILENAKEIHTVDTSLTLILAKLKMKNVFIYERINVAGAIYTEPNPNYIHKNLFCPEWNYYTSMTRDGF